MNSPHTSNLIRVLGWILIALGLLVNRYTLAWVAVDGVVGSWAINVVLLACQAIAVALGITLLRRPTRERLFTLALLGTGLGVAFLVLESGVRLRYFGWQGFSPRAMNSTDWLYDLGLLRAPAHNDIGWELQPNLDTVYAMAPLRTNSVGQCDTEHPFAKPQGEFRIAVLGDSFTMPQGTAIEDAWHMRLSKQLNDQGFAPGKKVTCINFGVAGYQLTNYRAVLEHKALAYQPDLILIGFCASNDDLLRPAASDKFRPIGTVPPFLHSYAATLAGLISGSPDSYRDLPRTPEDLAHVDQEFGNIARLCANEKIPVLVVYLGVQRGTPGPIQAHAQKYGFQFTDCTAALAEKPDPAHCVRWPFDPHPNATAHQAFAATTFDALTQSSADLSGTKP